MSSAVVDIVPLLFPHTNFNIRCLHFIYLFAYLRHTIRIQIIKAYMTFWTQARETFNKIGFNWFVSAYKLQVHLIVHYTLHMYFTCPAGRCWSHIRLNYTRIHTLCLRDQARRGVTISSSQHHHHYYYHCTYAYSKNIAIRNECQ